MGSYKDFLELKKRFIAGFIFRCFTFLFFSDINQKTLNISLECYSCVFVIL